MDTSPRYAALVMISDCFANGIFDAEDIISELISDELNAAVVEAVEIVTHEDFMAAVIDAGLPTEAPEFVDEYPVYETYQDYRDAMEGAAE